MDEIKFNQFLILVTIVFMAFASAYGTNSDHTEIMNKIETVCTGK